MWIANPQSNTGRSEHVLANIDPTSNLPLSPTPIALHALSSCILRLDVNGGAAVHTMVRWASVTVFVSGELCKHYCSWRSLGSSIRLSSTQSCHFSNHAFFDFGISREMRQRQMACTHWQTPTWSKQFTLLITHAYRPLSRLIQHAASLNGKLVRQITSYVKSSSLWLSIYISNCISVHPL